MHGDIERVLISSGQIAERVAELAGQITADHAASAGGRDHHRPRHDRRDGLLRGPDPKNSHRDEDRPGHGQQLPGGQRPHAGGAGARPADRRHPRPARAARRRHPRQRRHPPAGRRRSCTQAGPPSVKTCVLLRKDRPAARESPSITWGSRSPTSSSSGTGWTTTTTTETSRHRDPQALGDGRPRGAGGRAVTHASPKVGSGRPAPARAGRTARGPRPPCRGGGGSAPPRTPPPCPGRPGRRWRRC